MAYDGLFIKKQIYEIQTEILDEHISRITQKSPKEINFHFRKNSKNFILTLSSDPSFPYMLLDKGDIENMNTPLSFCMLLRKYLQSGVIKNISQVNTNSNNNTTLERIVKINIENIDNNGDISNFNIYFEIMGKYSNIVLTDDDNIIIDVLNKSKSENTRLKPKEKYDFSSITNKKEILNEDDINFMKVINNEKSLAEINSYNFDFATAISKNYAGLSKNLIVSEILKYIKSDHNNYQNFNYLILNKYFDNNESIQDFLIFFKNDISNLISSNTSPVINYKNGKPSDLYFYKLKNYEGETINFNNLNVCLKAYINEKFSNINDNIETKNLNDIINSLFNKLNKKIDTYKSDLNKCKDYEKYKKYGELISAFGYDKNNIKNGILFCEDYADNNIKLEIPIDESISIAKNVENYYNKYNKCKRTIENAEKLIKETENKIEHLHSINNSMQFSNDTNDLYLIKEEILNYFDEAKKISKLNNQKNNIVKRFSNKKNKFNYNIHHYKSSSGIDIYVGKNNLQNEYLTFTIANPNDTWLHIKNATGSHVIIKKPYESMDEKTLIEAASIAAYYSEKKNETKATVDYTLRKELKKVKGKAPGFCIYHKNYSINVKPEILIKEVK